MYSTQSPYISDRTRGLTLIELLVAFAIISVTVVVSLDLFMQILKDRPPQVRAQELTRATGYLLDDMLQEARISREVEFYTTLTIGGVAYRVVRFYTKDAVNGRPASVTDYRWESVLATHRVFKVTDVGTSDEATFEFMPTNIKISAFNAVQQLYVNPVTGLSASVVMLRLYAVHTEAATFDEGLLVQTIYAVRTI